MVSKNCQAYEKQWRNYCVDKNLDERWLADLNDLKVFNLISICEGHHTQQKNPSTRFPHINLKLKEPLLPDLRKDWETLRAEILGKVNALFMKGDTYFNLELRSKIRAGRGRLVYQEELILKMRGYQARKSEKMDSDCYQWFEQTVESTQIIDQIVSEFCAKNQV